MRRSPAWWIAQDPATLHAHEHRLERYPDHDLGLDVIFCADFEDPRCTLFAYPKEGYVSLKRAGFHSW